MAGDGNVAVPKPSRLFSPWVDAHCAVGSARPLASCRRCPEMEVRPDLCPHQPIFLVADSDPLLFWKTSSGALPFLRQVQRCLCQDGQSYDAIRRDVRLAYIGACNGDVSDFFDIFTYAMKNGGLVEDASLQCRHITTQPSPDDLAWLAKVHSYTTHLGCLMDSGARASSGSCSSDVASAL